MVNQKASILVIDDDTGYPLLLEKVFRMAGLPGRLTHLEDAEKALAYLEERSNPEGADGLPGLVLLDINMPGMNGFELLRRLRESERLQSLPVIMFSISQSPEDIRRAYSMGANAYITKPTGFQQIQAMLRDVHQFWFQCARLS